MAHLENGPIETRAAEPREIERMSCQVLWMYRRGQIVALWKTSGLISLLPETFPASQVTRLQQSAVPGREEASTAFRL